MGLLRRVGDEGPGGTHYHVRERLLSFGGDCWVGGVEVVSGEDDACTRRPRSATRSRAMAETGLVVPSPK